MQVYWRLRNEFCHLKELTIKVGDVPATYASTDLLFDVVGFKLENSIEDGLKYVITLG
ncbi:hypothetical protein [Psychrobacillus glaciei]|uniref:hypothetical protein n=1 Tax=Psychrobacillus glaciei TaxID=2283160 RepID=UPI00178C6C11|nr:hypothetical protein [Psychrobacillus glaciei]